MLLKMEALGQDEVRDFMDRFFRGNLHGKLSIQIHSEAEQSEEEFRLHAIDAALKSVSTIVFT